MKNIRTVLSCSAYIAGMLITFTSIFYTGCSKGPTEIQQVQDSTKTTDTTKKGIPPDLEITIDQTKYYTGMAISPDGSLVAMGDEVDHAAKIWDTKTGNLLATIPLAPITSPALMHFSKDNSKLIATDGTAPGFITGVFDITSASRICTIRSFRNFISDDGTKIIGDGFDTITFAPKIQIFSPVNGVILDDITPSGALPNPLIFGIVNGGSGFLYTADRLSANSPAAATWDISTNSETQNILLDVNAHSGIASEDGSIFAIPKNDSVATLYSTATGKKLSDLPVYIRTLAIDEYINSELPWTSITKNLTAKITVIAPGTGIAILNNSDGSVKSLMGSLSYRSVCLSRDESTMAAWCGNGKNNKVFIWHLK